MKKLFLCLIFILGLAVQVQAQSTTVSGTITDAGAQSWNSGTYQFTFVPNQAYQPEPQYTWTGGALTQNFAGTLSGTGTYSVSIPSNSAISPAGSTWAVTFCPLANSTCYFAGNITITGGTQTISPAPPAISISLTGTSSPSTRVYSTSEVAAAPLGAQIFLIGTGTQTCTAVTGNVCNTWTSAGGGGGVTQVTVLPGTCTPGAQYLLPSGSVVTCGPLANQFIYGVPNVLQATSFGVSGIGTNVNDITTTNGLATVSSTAQAKWCNAGSVPCPNGQPTSVGMTMVVWKTCVINAKGTDGEIVGTTSANPTILSVQSALSVTLSQNATFSATGNACADYGPLEDTAMTAIDTFLGNLTFGCPSIEFPSARMLFAAPHIYTNPIPCQNSGYPVNLGVVGGGLDVHGHGRGVTFFVPLPAFTWPGCTHGVTTHSCIGGIPWSEWHDLTITGDGQSTTNTTTSNAIGIELTSGMILRHAQLWNWGMYNSDFVGVQSRAQTACCFAEVDDVQQDGFGGFGLQVPAATNLKASGYNLQDNIGPGTDNAATIAGTLTLEGQFNFMQWSNS